MAIDVIKSIDVIETMENYIDSVRPGPEIRPKLDLGYEIIDQSVILNEIRPHWKKPEEIMKSGYAKATFVKSENIWKIFWKMSDLKWHVYKPCPTVKHLSDFLKMVDEDKLGCFKG